MKVGIFGGTFNPIHYGHLRVVEEVREKIALDAVLFIPSGNPPLKSADLAPPEHRYEMTRRALETNPLFRISDIECRQKEKSFTVKTLLALKEEHPEYEPYLILGIDSFLEIPLWYQPEQLMELTHVVVVSRPGVFFSSLSSRIPADSNVLSALDTGERGLYRTTMRTSRELVLLKATTLDISATGIRKLARNGMSLKYLLPEAVESYIISNNLYREGSDHL
jgi:nicotinate-nucleotide adenylyltransferase